MYSRWLRRLCNERGMHLSSYGWARCAPLLACTEPRRRSQASGLRSWQRSGAVARPLPRGAPLPAPRRSNARPRPACCSFLPLRLPAACTEWWAARFCRCLMRRLRWTAAAAPGGPPAGARRTRLRAPQQRQQRQGQRSQERPRMQREQQGSRSCLPQAPRQLEAAAAAARAPAAAEPQAAGAAAPGWWCRRRRAAAGAACAACGTSGNCWACRTASRTSGTAPEAALALPGVCP